MKPQPWIVEEELRRERERRSAWQPEPLHAPSPVPPMAPPREERDDKPANDDRGRVIIIDMESWVSVTM